MFTRVRCIGLGLLCVILQTISHLHKNDWRNSITHSSSKSRIRGKQWINQPLSYHKIIAGSLCNEAPGTQTTMHQLSVVGRTKTDKPVESIHRSNAIVGHLNFPEIDCCSIACADDKLLRWPSQPLRFSAVIWIFFISFFVTPNLRGLSVDRHQTLSRVRRWPKFMKFDHKFAGRPCAPPNTLAAKKASTRWAGQSPTWGRPSPQVRVQSQFRYCKFLSQQCEQTTLKTVS